MNRSSVYNQYHDKWAELYNSGKNTYEIASIYGCDRNTVGRFIKGIGIMRSKSDYTSHYKEYHSDWIDKYRSGMSIVEISNSYGCDSHTVSNALNKSGSIRPQGETNILLSQRKYVDIDTYFDGINTEEKSYFLGLLLADGCIHSRKGGQQILSLQLQIDDGYVVERLANVLGRNTSYTPPRNGKSDPYTHKAMLGMRATSDHIVNTLRGYGFTERKSTDNHDATVFKHIPSNLMRHFIHGIVDGDGSIGLRSDGRYGHIQVAGNKQDMTAISEVLSSIGCRKAVPYSHYNIYGISYSAKSDVTRILHYLYDDATIYLERKKARADSILGLYRSRAAIIV